MARTSFECDPSTPYHLSARCINKDWFELPMDLVWELMNRQLYLVKTGFGLKIFSFVLMTNHYHLIAQAPEGNLSEAMRYFQRATSRELTKASHRLNQTWGSRFFRSRLGSYHYFLQAYKYIYQNPLHAKTCQWVEEYPFSTLNGVLGFGKLLIPIEYDTVLFEGDLEETLRWLNQLPEERQKEEVRKALRRQDFVFVKDPRTKKRSSLEELLF
jgi:putative transposase